MGAIYKKEMAQYFRTPMGYVFLAILLLICGFYFTYSNLYQLNADVRSYFTGILMFIMFIIPLLTMRSFSEERKLKTDQLLYTSPVGLPSIVLGKFFAAMTVFCIGMGVTILFPVILGVYGDVDPFVAVGNYFGLILAVAAFVAIGVFISAKTENQISAAVASYCAIFFLWLVGSFSTYIRQGIFSQILDFIALSNRYTEFAMGMINPSSVLYYLSVVGIFLYLTVRSLDKRKDY